MFFFFKEQSVARCLHLRWLRPHLGGSRVGEGFEAFIVPVDYRAASMAIVGVPVTPSRSESPVESLGPLTGPATVVVRNGAPLRGAREEAGPPWLSGT